MSDHLEEFKDVMEKAHVEYTKSEEPKKSMSEPRFTPGPWRVRLYEHHIGRNYSIKRTHKVENKSGLQVVCTVTSGVYAQGNLALIAAAPEMYAELEDLLNALENLPQFASGVDFPVVFDKKIELRKLLRKARGESEVSE